MSTNLVGRREKRGGLELGRSRVYTGWVIRDNGGDENRRKKRWVKGPRVLKHTHVFLYGNYIDEVVMMRNVLDDDSRILGDFYYVYDAQYNCPALFASIARERIRYDAYGLPHVRYVADMEINDPSNGIIGDGDVDTNDWPIFRDAFGKAQCNASYNWLADYDGDGDVDTGDYSTFNRFFGKGVPSGYLSFFKNPFYFTGRPIDALDGGDLAVQNNSNRYYDPVTGRWLTRDPLGVQDGLALWYFDNSGLPQSKAHAAAKQYSDGMNVYEYVGSNPVVDSDSLGLYLGLGRDFADNLPGPRKKCGICGPDVTAQLTMVRSELSRKYNDPANDKDTLCDEMYSGDGWDIGDLHYETVQVPSGCATMDCEDTVMVGNKCYSVHEVNYYMWGIINQLCGEGLGKTTFYAHKWAKYGAPVTACLAGIPCKGDADCKKRWAESGYTNGPPPNCGSEYSGCEACGKPYAGDPFKTEWKGEK